MLDGSKDSLKGILNGDPNDKWMNVGIFTVAAGVVSLLGINIGGIEVAASAHSQYVPWLIIILGGCAMTYGTELRKNKIIAERNHEKRKRERVSPEPTRGALAFLEWFKKQDLPITVVELSKASFPYDDERTKKDVSSALRWSRAEFWVSQGAIKKHGDMYEMRE